MDINELNLPHEAKLLAKVSLSLEDVIIVAWRQQTEPYLYWIYAGRNVNNYRVLLRAHTYKHAVIALSELIEADKHRYRGTKCKITYFDELIG